MRGISTRAIAVLPLLVLTACKPPGSNQPKNPLSQSEVCQFQERPLIAERAQPGQAPGQTSPPGPGGVAQKVAVLRPGRSHYFMSEGPLGLVVDVQPDNPKSTRNNGQTGVGGLQILNPPQPQFLATLNGKDGFTVELASSATPENTPPSTPMTVEFIDKCGKRVPVQIMLVADFTAPGTPGSLSEQTVPGGGFGAPILPGAERPRFVTAGVTSGASSATTETGHDPTLSAPVPEN